jgi:prepilin-type processing-associated H-X9-DG protein
VRTPQTTAEILMALAQNASVPFERARSLPPAIYHDKEILRLETDYLFGQEWICIGRDAEIPRPGDYLCRMVVDTPVACIRQKDGSIRALVNSCRHRGAQILFGDGHASRLSCPYHSWTYGIDGRLLGAPFMKGTAGFDGEDYGLPSLGCEIWQGFVYVTLARKADSLLAGLAELEQRLADFRLAAYEPVFACEETWDTNWKCLAENFMDAYHVHRVHRESFARYGSSEDITTLHPGGEAYSFHLIQENEERHSVHAHADNTWLKGEDRYKTYLISIFPSHVMQLQPDMLWYLSILPLGVDKVDIRWAVSIPAEILASATNRQAAIDDVVQLIQQVNGEDRPVVENVFRATRSPFAAQGPLSYLERNVWDFGRYLARKLCQQSSGSETS